MTTCKPPSVYQETVTLVEREAIGYREFNKTYDFAQLKETFGHTELVSVLICEIERLRACLKGVSSCATCDVCREAAHATLRHTDTRG